MLWLYCKEQTNWMPGISTETSDAFCLDVAVQQGDLNNTLELNRQVRKDLQCCDCVWGGGFFCRFMDYMKRTLGISKEETKCALTITRWTCESTFEQSYRLKTTPPSSFLALVS